MRALVLIQSELIWLWRVFQFARIIASSSVASWFETREDALLTMKVYDLILRESPYSSWPGLSRPSTSLLPKFSEDVDARDKPGHDELDALRSEHSKLFGRPPVAPEVVRHLDVR